ncbi:MAG: DUF2877 domain-containing protein [Lacrimispora sp.]|uniref:DUF2877 domain-containing protein n=1 Tax=Lacrimispora sp. TaxID=2719234 RepID=UPI0039E3DAA3
MQNITAIHRSEWAQSGITADVTLEEGLKQTLAKGEMAGIIHSVFCNVINWREEKTGCLYCLTSSKIDAAHETAVTSLLTLEYLNAAPGMSVRFGLWGISFDGELKVTFRSVRTVTLALPQWPSHTGPLAAALPNCERRLKEQGSPGGMLPHCQAKGFGKALAQSLQNGRAAAEEAVRNKNVQAFLEAAEALLGLGYGLTPSGDDYLSGLLLTLHIPGGPLEDWAKIGRTVANVAEVSTTDIGAWELNHAARGLPRQDMAGFLESLFAGDGAYVTYLDKIISVGSLSGTDIATGILAGLRLALEATQN